MKTILLTISILLLSIVPAGAVKKIHANPINIAIQLVEKTDSDKVASTLEYYGYTPQGKEDGYQKMKGSNGNEIRYSFNECDPNHKYPTIIVKTQGTHKALDSKLKELNFEKVGNGYECMKNKNSKYKTQYSFGPKSTLIIRRIQI